MMELYDPGDDSYLLVRHVESEAKGKKKVLDMGTGSGIQAIAAAKHAKEVIGCDINPLAVKSAKLQAQNDGIKNISFIESDLFENINEKFDLIIFNPPYLPEDGIEDIRLTSPRRGMETTMRFLDGVSEHLSKDGIILLISSSLASRALFAESISKNLFDSEIIDKAHVFFEDIFLHRIKRSPSHLKALDKGIVDPKLFAHGKRGMIITGMIGEDKVAMKIKRDDSDAPFSMENEGIMLKRVNELGIGPNLISADKKSILYHFIDGVFIREFFESASKEDILKVISDVLDQCHRLDEAGINKFEMTNPYKHVVIDKNLKSWLLDFERARFSERPKNVTQFINYLAAKNANDTLHAKGIMWKKDMLIALGVDYHEDKDIEKIIQALMAEEDF